MRSDYALYFVAIIFFAITGISYFVFVEFERNLSVVATVMLGLLSLGFGYTQRSTKKATAIQVQLPQPTSLVVSNSVDQSASSPTTIEAPPPPPTPQTSEPLKQETVEPVIEAVKQKIELTAVKGVKEKRMKQLKTLNINSVEDLAKASAKDLAAKLKISPKFTEKWIQNAKNLIEKA